MKTQKERTVYVRSVRTVFGEIQLAETDRGVCRIALPNERRSSAGLSEWLANSKMRNFRVVTGGQENKKAARQIKEYFAGKRKTFDFKIDFQAGGFKRKALLEGVRKIPYGQTRSYSDIAKAVGNPRACRAVGNANATNPLPLVIPCHRVVGAHGLGGYGGGLEMKRRLLELEGANYER